MWLIRERLSHFFKYIFIIVITPSLHRWLSRKKGLAMAWIKSYLNSQHTSLLPLVLALRGFLLHYFLKKPLHLSLEKRRTFQSNGNSSGWAGVDVQHLPEESSSTLSYGNSLSKRKLESKWSLFPCALTGKRPIVPSTPAEFTFCPGKSWEVSSVLFSAPPESILAPGKGRANFKLDNEEIHTQKKPKQL